MRGAGLGKTSGVIFEFEMSFRDVEGWEEIVLKVEGDTKTRYILRVIST